MAKLNLEAVLSLIDKVSEPLKNITQSSDKVTSAFKKQQDEMKKLNQTMSNISSFKRMNEALKQTGNELKLAQEKAQRLAREYAQTEKPTRAMTKALEQARKAVRDLEQQQQQQILQQQNYRRALNEAGINTKRLIQAEQELKSKIEQGNATLEKRKKRLEQIKQAQDNYQKAQEKMTQLREKSAGLAMGATATAGAMVVPIKFAMDFESSMADVKKVVNFDTPQQFKEMENDIINLSKRLPMTANEIANIVSAGGQSGIKKDELLSFAESSVKMGVAFDITADEAGQAMAEMRTAFKLTQPEVVALADKINWLGNNSPNKASKIMEVVQRVGSLAEIGGYAADSVSAMAGSLTAVQPDVAATGIKNIILALTKGASATKSQKDAFKDLGLNHEKVAKDMQVDANKTLDTVLTAIGKLDKHKQVAITNDLFGSEALPIVAQYAQNIDVLRKNLQAVGDKTKYAGSMEAEYASRAATTANNLILLKNKSAAVAITTGATLLPMVNLLFDRVGEVANKIHAWASLNPELSATLMKVGVGLVVVLSALSAGALAITALIGPLALLKVSLASLGLAGAGAGIMAFFARFAGIFAKLGGMIRVAMTAVFSAIPVLMAKIGTAFTWLLGILRAVAVFFMANPIVLAITLIATAVFLIYRNWGRLVPFFTSIWNRVKSGAVALWQALKSGFASALQAIIAMIASFSPVGMFMRAFGAVRSYFASLGAEFASYGRNIMTSLANGIAQSAGEAVARARAVASSVVSQVKGVFSINSPSKVFRQIGVWNMQGLAQGIDKTAHLPQSSITTASQNMLTAFDNSQVQWQRGSSLQPRMVTAGATAQPIQTFNIYASEGMNEQELARLVALEVAKIQRMNESNQRRSYADYA